MGGKLQTLPPKPSLLSRVFLSIACYHLNCLIEPMCEYRASAPAATSPMDVFITDGKRF